MVGSCILTIFKKIVSPFRRINGDHFRLYLGVHFGSWDHFVSCLSARANAGVSICLVERSVQMLAINKRECKLILNIFGKV